MIPCMAFHGQDKSYKSILETRINVMLNIKNIVRRCLKEIKFNLKAVATKSFNIIEQNPRSKHELQRTFRFMTLKNKSSIRDGRIRWTCRSTDTLNTFSL